MGLSPSLSNIKRSCQEKKKKKGQTVPKIHVSKMSSPLLLSPLCNFLSEESVLEDVFFSTCDDEPKPPTSVLGFSGLDCPDFLSNFLSSGFLAPLGVFGRCRVGEQW